MKTKERDHERGHTIDKTRSLARLEERCAATWEEYELSHSRAVRNIENDIDTSDDSDCGEFEIWDDEAVYINVRHSQDSALLRNRHRQAEPRSRQENLVTDTETTSLLDSDQVRRIWDELEAQKEVQVVQKQAIDALIREKNTLLAKLESQKDDLEKKMEEQIQEKEENMKKQIQEMLKKLQEGTSRNSFLKGECGDNSRAHMVNPYLNNGTSHNEEQNNDGTKEEQMIQDTFSFIVCSKKSTFPFWFGIFFVILQMTSLALLTANLYKSCENPFGIPPNVEYTVRITQFIAMIIAILSQNELRTAVNQVSEGYNSDVHANFQEASASKWWLACGLRFLEGAAGLIVAFILIITSSNVKDLLLNFTAVEFLFSIDDIAFFVASKGMFGRTLLNKTEEINNTTLRQRIRTKTMLQSQIFLFLIVCALLFGWVWVIIEQTGSDHLCNQIEVDFADNVNIELGGVSGIYNLDKQKQYGRVQYVRQQSSKDKGFKLSYCKPQLFWALSSIDEKKDVCTNWMAKSHKTDNFDIRTTISKQWVARESKTENEVELDFSKLTCLDSSTTQKKCIASFNVFDRKESTIICSGTDGNPCKCEAEHYGIQCKWTETCPSLEADPGFPGSDDWSKHFVLLDGGFNSSIQSYFRPIYVGKTDVPSKTKSVVDLLFYCGRRWVLTNTGALKSLNNITSSYEIINNGGFYLLRKKIAEYFRKGFQMVDLFDELVQQSALFMSEPSLSSDSPVGLKWYYVKNTESNMTNNIPLPDLNRALNATLSCGICNTNTKKCFHEGTCLANQTCHCANRATGNQCQKKPLADGICDTYFNIESDNYDGGDCCATTCNAANCGKSRSNFVFGAELNESIIGYKNCKNPEMIPLVIDIFGISRDRSSNEGAIIDSVKLTCGNVTILNFRSFKTMLREPETVFIPLNSTCALRVEAEADKHFGYEVYMPVSEKIAGLDVHMSMPESNKSDRVYYANGTGHEKQTIDFHVFTPCFIRSAIEGTDSCFHEGQCRWNGLCECVHRTLGTHCEVKPLRDGYCDDYFNTATYNYDGGDCCGATCKSTLCGHGGLTHAFGLNFTENQYGYQNCKNQTSVPIIFNIENPSYFEIESINLICDSITYLDIKNMSKMLIDTHTVYLEAGSRCNMSIKSDFFNYSFEVYHHSEQTGAMTFLAIGESDDNGDSIQDFFVTESCWMTEVSAEAYENQTEFDQYKDNLFMDIVNWVNTLLSPSFICKEYPKQRYAAYVLLLSINFPNYELPDEEEHECDWHGIGCDSRNIVSQVLLSRTNPDLSFASGFLPTQIGLLSRLEIFQVKNHKMRGTIPTEIGLLARLKNFSLWHTFDVSGIIPIEIGKSSKLEVLELGVNKLSGTIPSQIARLQHLTQLELNVNKLSGTIPSEYRGLKNLHQFILDHNDVSGTIPSELGELVNLRTLKMASNKLSGSIPSHLFTLNELEVLYLNDNKLTGKLPTMKFEKLGQAYLYNNRVTGPLNCDSAMSLWETLVDCNQVQCTPSCYCKKFGKLCPSARCNDGLSHVRFESSGYVKFSLDDWGESFIRNPYYFWNTGKRHLCLPNNILCGRFDLRWFRGDYSIKIYRNDKLVWGVNEKTINNPPLWNNSTGHFCIPNNNARMTNTTTAAWNIFWN